MHLPPSAVIEKQTTPQKWQNRRKKSPNSSRDNRKGSSALCYAYKPRAKLFLHTYTTIKGISTHYLLSILNYNCTI